MKIIDLLSINKKEMPKCVKHYSGIYVWDKEEGDFFKGSGEGLLQWCVSSFDTQNHFIDEVEIIEEEKKIPEKIKDKYCSQISKVELAQKYNEIIDYLKYLNSKGD